MDVLWRTELNGRVLEVKLHEARAVDSDAAFDPLEAGPVHVTRGIGGVVEVLGDAPTLSVAMSRWEELREVGDAVECTWAGSVDQLAEFLQSNLRLAPPEGWADGGPDTFFSVPVNGGWIDDLDLQDFPWERVASYESFYGGTSMDYWDRWYRWWGTDEEPSYGWAGPDPDLVSDGISFVAPPQMSWPGGNDLDVSVEGLSQNGLEDLAEQFRLSDATGYFQSISVNDVTVWPEPDITATPAWQTRTQPGRGGTVSEHTERSASEAGDSGEEPAHGALGEVLMSLRIGTANRKYMRTRHGSAPLLQPLDRAEFRDSERRAGEERSVRDTAGRVAQVHQHAYAVRSMAAYAGRLAGMAAALDADKAAASVARIAGFADTLLGMAEAMSGLSADADQLLDDTIESLTQGASDSQVQHQLAAVSERAGETLAASNEVFEATCRTVAGVAALHEPPGPPGEEPLWDAARAGLESLDMSLSATTTIEVLDRPTLEIEMTGLAVRVMSHSRGSHAAAVSLGAGTERGLAVYHVEADTYVCVEGGRQAWDDPSGPDEDQQRLADLGLELSEKVPPGWRIQLDTTSASAVGRFLTTVLVEHHGAEPGDQLTVTTGEYSFYPLGGPTESITSAFDHQRINESAMFAAQAWLTGRGIFDAIGDLRSNADGDPIPAPGVDEALDALTAASEAVCDTADTVDAITESNADAETIEAISSAHDRVLDATLDCRNSLRRLAQLCLGVTSMLSWSTAVARAERAAVATLVDSAIRLEADTACLELLSTSAEELAVELAGVVSRIVLDHDTHLRLRSSSATAPELSLVTDSTGTLTLTCPVAAIPNDVLPSLLTSGWEADEDRLTASWPSDLTVIEPVELIVETLDTLGVADIGDLRLDNAPATDGSGLSVDAD